MWSIDPEMIGETLTLTPAHIERIIERSKLYPEGEIMIVGFRSGKLLSAPGAWLDSVELVGAAPDYQSFCCTLTLYDRKHHKLAAFPASTYPNISYITEQLNAPDKRIANRLSEGLYSYIVGAHEPNHGPKEEGAFRLSRLQPVPVWRILDRNVKVDQAVATLDLSVADDHIHSAQSTREISGRSFSSAGCQVIEGDHTPPNAPTGLYQTFRVMAGQSFMPDPDEIGQPYSYLLLSFEALFYVATGVPEARYFHGSRGYEVRRLQEALMEKGFLAEEVINKGYFNGYTAKALYDFQQQNGLEATGFATEVDGKALGVSLFSLR